MERVLFSLCVVLSFIAHGQSSLSISTPMIWSTAKVKDNWTPTTAPYYKEYLTGTALGSGINLKYFIKPKFILKGKAKHFNINVGLGYFKQKFDISRPFDYASFVQIIYRTSGYSYQCWNWSVGLKYSYPINAKYELTADLSYQQFRSFQQDYAPTSGDPIQTNRFSIDFAKIVTLTLGVERKLGKYFSVSFNLLLPAISWRNDRIFRDDPSTYYHPSFSFGNSFSLIYRFRTKNI
ncbi:MAG: autotransporter outer membrane beta-barrel domain-containing protein [Bacteroidetes bacterium]|nr:autotransporter outer membrane beta-barrel domain-containing protein [Bacteroidota bacterium]